MSMALLQSAQRLHRAAHHHALTEAEMPLLSITEGEAIVLQILNSEMSTKTFCCCLQEAQSPHANLAQR